MLKRQTQDTLEAVGEARDFASGNIPAGQWRNLHDELELVAGKEWASVKHDQTKDRLLRAHYDCFPDRNNPLWPKEMPRPQFYLWDLTHGPTEDIRAQFVGVANRIGKLLGCPQGTEPLDFTLYRLVLSLKENKSSYIKKYSDEDGGIIFNVCEALMAFCSRLAAESEAAEPTAAPEPTEGYPGETTTARLPKTVAEWKRCDKEKRKTIIANFIAKVTDAKRKITRKDISTVAGYKTGTELERFQRCDSRSTKTANMNFHRVLNMNPDDFIKSLESKQKEK